MVADRVMMGDIIGSTATVDPGVRQDDGRGGLGFAGGRGVGELANWRTGELANWRNIHSPIELNLCPLTFAFAALALHLQLSRCNAERAPVDCH
ncbi:hypothetical protein NHF48_018185 [Sphingomonas sp. H160509]|uniref:hypothetical protein n=1 Tax=Sphingomonas sp. H160509 TaxID=2955313 RepID=UPI0021E92272|nr:hypothetical protein [Sphingomonas sp. H160509]MDD1452411.1 hypothetical protein [Sphingomonas sp. H160509]